MTEEGKKKGRKRRVLATLLLGETMTTTMGATCGPPQICDPVPPPPSATPFDVSNTPRTGGVNHTASPSATPITTPTVKGAGSVSPTATPRLTPAPIKTPPMICDPVPAPPTKTPSLGSQSYSLPLQERLRVQILKVEDKPPTFRLAANFQPEKVRWLVDGGALEFSGNLVIWRPPSKKGRYLLQAVVDAGRTGVAVDALAIEV